MQFTRCNEQPLIALNKGKDKEDRNFIVFWLKVWASQLTWPSNRGLPANCSDNGSVDGWFPGKEVAQKRLNPAEQGSVGWSSLPPAWQEGRAAVLNV